MTTWHADTPPWYSEAAERVCTAKQLEVLKLVANRASSYQQIGDQLGISRQAAEQRHINAHRRLIAHFREHPPTRQEPAA